MSTSAWHLSGRFAVVTGGSEGIGLATARELRELGASVLIVSRSPAKLAHAREDLGPDVQVLAADLTTAAGRESLAQQIRTVGRLDVLVNNLGKADRARFLEMSEATARELFELNLWSTTELLRLVFPQLREARGSVVNLSSVAGHRVLPERLWYGAAKAALDFATKALAAEWGEFEIRVNSVSPWFTRTPLTESVLSNPVMLEKIREVTPLGRPAEAEEIAKAVAFLALPASRYITGTDLIVDGGYLAGGRI